MKVFIAENSLIVSERLASLLLGYEEIEIVGKAHDIREAKESIWRLKPDVVILDIRIPGGSGFDILRFLQNREINTKVIMLANYSYPQLRERCKELGVDFFFDKSEEFEKIPEALNELLVNYAHQQTHDTVKRV
ncbi:response regulator transcription factor [Candidatus Sumerlaeota bacterium]|nr:response regulator transcription factor [Candidatus Sumerlaeota bacterium]